VWNELLLKPTSSKASQTVKGRFSRITAHSQRGQRSLMCSFGTVSGGRSARFEMFVPFITLCMANSPLHKPATTSEKSQ
jgi:hypothetical protein